MRRGGRSHEKVGGGAGSRGPVTVTTFLPEQGLCKGLLSWPGGNARQIQIWREGSVENPLGMLEILGSDEGGTNGKVGFAVERKWQDLVPDDRFQRL